MEIETVSDLAEKLADWLGIYGGCKNIHEDDCECDYDKGNPFCCRQGFVGAMEERIQEAVKNTEKLNSIGISQYPLPKHSPQQPL